MYKKLYLTLFNRISVFIDRIEETANKAEDVNIKKELFETIGSMKTTQCMAEKIIIDSEETIE